MIDRLRRVDAPAADENTTIRSGYGGSMALAWERNFDWNGGGWRARAACRDSAPDLFFPIGATGLALDQIEAAKTICQRCVVQAECLEFALETNQEAGIWGGTSEDERRRLRRDRAEGARIHAQV